MNKSQAQKEKTDYIPYGEQWFAYMMRINKERLPLIFKWTDPVATRGLTKKQMIEKFRKSKGYGK